MAQKLNVSDVVSVQVVMSPVAAALRNFGSLLILGDSDVIDTTERLRQYSGIESIAQEFGTTAPEYLAALLYYGQTPQPETLYIGKWARAATKAVLHGGILSAAEQALANFTAITNGGFSIVIDGGAATNVTALNLGAVTTLSGVAAAVQAKLPAGVYSKRHNLPLMATRRKPSGSWKPLVQSLKCPRKRRSTAETLCRLRTPRLRQGHDAAGRARQKSWQDGRRVCLPAPILSSH